MRTMDSARRTLIRRLRPMKRTRRSTQVARNGESSGDYPCPFAGCSAVLETDVAYKAHVSAHCGDRPVKCLECGERFAYAAEAREHFLLTHNGSGNLESTHDRRRADGNERVLRKRRKSVTYADDYDLVEPVTMEVGGGEGAAREGSDGASLDEQKANSMVLNVEDDDSDGQTLEQEADEIASNAAYFAEQLRVARSVELATWNGGDYDNAHRWAIWVMENVADFPDQTALARALRKKHLSIPALQNAERALFDSVMGFEELTSDIMTNLARAAAGADNAAERDGYSSSLDCLADSASAAIRRKQTLAHLAGALAEFSNLNDVPQPVTYGLRDLRVSPPSQTCHVSAAKARVLLQRHARLAEQELSHHLDEMCEDADAETMEILCREATTETSGIAAGETVAKTKGVKGQIVTQLTTLSRSQGSTILWNMDARLITELCELDFELFAQYISYLLANHHAITLQIRRNQSEIFRGADGEALGTIGTVKDLYGSTGKSILEEELRPGGVKRGDVDKMLRDIEHRLQVLQETIGAVGAVSTGIIRRYYASAFEKTPSALLANP